MRAFCFQAVLLVSTLLILSFSHGSCRKMMVETFGHQDAPASVSVSASVSVEEKARDTIQLDYIDAGPNYNAKGGYLFTPPLPPPPPPPSSED